MRLKKKKPKNRSCERPNEKEKQPWHHWKGRRTLPKARAGIGVEKKLSEDAEKTVRRAGGGKRTPKKARAGLGWQK